MVLMTHNLNGPCVVTQVLFSCHMCVTFEVWEAVQLHMRVYAHTILHTQLCMHKPLVYIHESQRTQRT